MYSHRFDALSGKTSGTSAFAPLPHTFHWYCTGHHEFPPSFAQEGPGPTLLPGEISALQLHTLMVLFCEQCGAWLLLVTPLAATSIIEKLLQLVVGDLFLSTCSYLTMKQKGSYSKTKN